MSHQGTYFWSFFISISTALESGVFDECRLALRLIGMAFFLRMDNVQNEIDVIFRKGHSAEAAHETTDDYKTNRVTVGDDPVKHQIPETERSRVIPQGTNQVITSFSCAASFAQVRLRKQAMTSAT